jgi:hypothetical protein
VRKATLLIVGLVSCTFTNAVVAQDATTRFVNDEANNEFLLTIGPVELPLGATEG